jgi:hypothetical protein
MSLADLSVSQAPIAGQAPLATVSAKPPKNRQIVAKADAVDRPEAR